MRSLALTAAIVTIASPGVLSGQTEGLSVGDVALRYEIDGSGPAVVLVHGWGNSLESWHFLAPDLARDYTVLRYDRRGFGQSGGVPDLSLDPVDLLALLDSLNLEQPVVIGHSQGGLSALRFAVNYPDRLAGLVLFGSSAPDGFGLPFDGPDALPAAMVRVARQDGLDAMRALFEHHPITAGFVDGTEGSDIMDQMFGAYEGKDLLTPAPSANATEPADVGSLAGIRAPTLVIHGEMEMPYFQIVAAALEYGIPTARRIVVPGGGHSVHLQRPAVFNREVRGFLRSIAF